MLIDIDNLAWNYLTFVSIEYYMPDLANATVKNGVVSGIGPRIKKSQKTFINTIRQGECLHWYKTGILKSRCYYKDDILDRKYEEWYENGQRRLVKIIVNGGDVYLKKWHENGKVDTIIKFTHPNVPCYSSMWYPSGQKKDIMVKSGDSFNYISWHENGNMYRRYSRRALKYNGLSETWFENGNKKSEITYVNSEKMGVFKMWNEAGELIEHKYAIGHREYPLA